MARLPFLSPTSRNHRLDLILSSTTKTANTKKGHHALYVDSQMPVPHHSMLVRDKNFDIEPLLSSASASCFMADIRMSS